MSALVDLFSLACGIAGWFYLFYSKAAVKLAPLESPTKNILRIRLRRFCGAAMVLLGIGVYAGFNAVDDRTHPGIYLAVWSASMLLLLLIVGLVSADIHLTKSLRKPHESSRNQP